MTTDTPTLRHLAPGTRVALPLDPSVEGTVTAFDTRTASATVRWDDDVTTSQHGTLLVLGVRYDVLTPNRIQRVTAASNSVPDITAAIRAAGIRPLRVQAISPVDEP